MIKKFLKLRPGYVIQPPLGKLYKTLGTDALLRVAGSRLVKKTEWDSNLKLKHNLKINTKNLKDLLAQHPGKKLAFFNEGSMATQTWANLKPILEASLIDA